MTQLPSPLLVPDRITTLVGPPDNEMAALVAALAVSYKTGSPLVPGFVPEGPSEVRVYAYRFTWIDWSAWRPTFVVSLELHLRRFTFVARVTRS